jgi:hypothetical protein
MSKMPDNIKGRKRRIAVRIERFSASRSPSQSGCRLFRSEHMRRSVFRGGYVIALSLVGSFAHPAAAQEIVPGTYRFWLCADPCSPPDSARAVARGIIVLFGDALEQQQRTGLERLEGMERIPPGQPAAQRNACFLVTQRSDTVRGEELFFGIIPASATRWTSRTPSESSMLVYQSPDAFYELRFKANERGFEGQGWSAGWQIDVDWHQNTSIVAERRGPPDADACRPSG